MFTSTETALFRRDGYLIINGLLTDQQVMEARGNLSRLVAQADELGAHPSGYHLDREPGTAADADRELGIRKFRDLGQADQFFWDVVRTPAVVERVAALHGTGCRVIQTMALVKPPEIGSAKDWHQDIPYFPLSETHTCVGVWIALDDATLDNGCMQVIPGSHHLGPVAHVQGPTGWRLEPALCAHLAPAVHALPMRAGAALFFDGRLLHFTDCNRSQRRRRALQNHYVGPTCGFAAGRTGGMWELNSPVPPFLERISA